MLNILNITLKREKDSALSPASIAPLKILWKLLRKYKR